MTRVPFFKTRVIIFGSIAIGFLGYLYLCHLELSDTGSPSLAKMLANYEANRILETIEVEVLESRLCVSIVNDERKVKDGFARLPSRFFKLDVMTENVSVGLIKGTDLAMVTIRKPYASHLKACEPQSK